jgi:hypothetical protein
MTHPIKVLATGFVVLVLLSLPLFWIRFICEASITAGMPEETQSIDRVQPCGIVPPEIENDPNVAHHSSVSASLHDEEKLASLGIGSYLISRYPGGSLSDVYQLGDSHQWIYFDKTSGLLACNYTGTQVLPDRGIRFRIVRAYVGPEGIAETPDKTLGRFVDPIIENNWSPRNPQNPRELIVYDKQLRRFIKIDFGKMSTVKGPELPIDKSDQPIQIGRLQACGFPMYLHWQSPSVKVSRLDPNDVHSSSDYQPILPDLRTGGAGPYLLALHQSGVIHLLDRDTLKFAQVAGSLPAPETYFGTKPSVTPKDLLGYQVWPLVLSKFYLADGKLHKMAFGEPELYELEAFDASRRARQDGAALDMLYELDAFDASPSPRASRQMQSQQVASRVEREYLGMFVASVSRDGTAMALAVFNAQGKRVKIEYTSLPIDEGRHTSYLQSTRAAYWKAPWAPVATISKYLVENLHPPILSLASCFTASAFEAGSGHRALFLLPNSFVAIIARDAPENIAERLFSVLALMLPSIILALWLNWRVGKDAALVGLSRKARRWWTLGILAFSLAGYITYRLTRPKVTLVTCVNCGHPRRPDMDKCHRCASPWHVPELTPPAWRVLDSESAAG